MGQHNNFAKDMNLLAEAYGSMEGSHFMMGMGVADQAADALAHEDGYNSPEEAAEDKTGDESDAELIKKYTYKDKDGEVHLTDAGRDALSKAEDNEDAYERDLDAKDKAQYGFEQGHPTD